MFSYLFHTCFLICSCLLPYLLTYCLSYSIAYFLIYFLTYLLTFLINFIFTFILTSLPTFVLTHLYLGVLFMFQICYWACVQNLACSQATKGALSFSWRWWKRKTELNSFSSSYGWLWLTSSKKILVIWYKIPILFLWRT